MPTNCQGHKLKLEMVVWLGLARNNFLQEAFEIAEKIFVIYLFS